VARPTVAGQDGLVRGKVEPVDAAIFDVDGVVTRTETVHEAAWRTVFDDVLRAHADAENDPFVPFSSDDYRRYVDGMSRYDGVRRFLASRSISLPTGRADDPPTRDTICGIGNRKNDAFLTTVAIDGVQPFETTIALVRRLRDLGVGTAAVSASENCAAVLRSAGVIDLFDARVDGVVANEAHLAGKPDPAMFLEAARRLGVAPSHAAVIEDAIAGVEAGRRGGFALVVGVDRSGHAQELADAGADLVVTDLAEVVVDDRRRWS
jgi:alpha,alpha-trehalase